MTARVTQHESLSKIFLRSPIPINIIPRSPRFIHASFIASRYPLINNSRANSFNIPGQTTQRHFTYSTPLSKKKDKNNKKGDDDVVDSKGKNDNSSPADPFDLTQLHNGISDAITRLKEDLQKLRSGGRFNPEVIENLRVNLSKKSNETVKLGEVAQVVPKGGRSVAIIVGEENLIKPVNSAIIASNLSLTPQPDQHNALQLNVPIPPPTKESRDQAVKTAKSAMEKASTAVKNSRASIHKRLQDMQKKKEARPDDIRKAHGQMEKVVEKGQKDIKEVFDSARKSLEQA